MEELKKFNGTLLSLGYSCSPKKVIDIIKGKGPSHYFDWVGSSAWYINNHFLSENHEIKYEDLEVQKVRKYFVVVHPEYYLRLVHIISPFNIKKEEKVNEVLQSFERKRERFINALKEAGENNKTICFLRVAEPMEDRVIPEDKKHYYEKEEEEHLAEFQAQIKEKYNVDSKVILFTTTKETQKVGNVLVLKSEKEIRYIHANKKMSKVLYNNKELVKEFLKN